LRRLVLLVRQSAGLGAGLEDSGGQGDPVDDGEPRRAEGSRNTLLRSLKGKSVAMPTADRPSIVGMLCRATVLDETCWPRTLLTHGRHRLAAAGQQMITESRPSSRLLIVALLLTGLSMRTAVTSVGAVLDDLEHGLHANGSTEGLITALPVICFAALGALTPRISQRIGSERLLVAALIAATTGLVLRATAGSVWMFALLSVLALSGAAVSNVLMPSLVKRYFPAHIGRITAVYTTALATGTTLAAGLTVPIGDLGDGWRLGLGSWAVLTAVAILPWLPGLKRDRREVTASRGIAATRLAASQTAWALTAFFGFQNMQTYIIFGWFVKFLHAHDISSGTAGWMVALFSALSIPVSMVVPTFASVRLRPVITVVCGCSLIAYVGLAVAPNGGAWLWMVLAGLGAGAFPVALTMIGLRARNAESTAALSSFVQAIGYVVAGAGSLLFGFLYGSTQHWTLPLVLLIVALVLTYLAGIVASRERFVDDELAMSPPPLDPNRI
jgi:CP family cyanate transporter-like MFS transporter